MNDTSELKTMKTPIEVKIWLIIFMPLILAAMVLVIYRIYTTDTYVPDYYCKHSLPKHLTYEQLRKCDEWYQQKN